MPDVITTAVAAVMSNGTDYTASLDGTTTHCSDFVRDFWAQLQFSPTPVLAGQANDQVTALLTSSWTKSSLSGASSDALQQAFNDADSAASSGKVVLVGWLNPNWTGPGDPDHHGHIAIVVPSAGDSLQTSGTWPNLSLPFIAQAGPRIPDLATPADPAPSVFAKIKLSWGFGIDKQPGMTIFTNNA